jgi:hypothetical protein
VTGALWRRLRAAAGPPGPPSSRPTLGHLRT